MLGDGWFKMWDGDLKGSRETVDRGFGEIGPGVLLRKNSGVKTNLAGEIGVAAPEDRCGVWGSIFDVCVCVVRVL
jgi:hypothetical protein